MSKRNACDNCLLHTKNVKRRVKNKLLMKEKTKRVKSDCSKGVVEVKL
uniref:Uncharacterized protein n=1 Tax=Daphnia galeata TaxID=27404 RepID=A0A8J2RYK5_9CRUS|nr:unnamed protein product [Daphnia galeata]